MKRTQLVLFTIGNGCSVVVMIFSSTGFPTRFPLHLGVDWDIMAGVVLNTSSLSTFCGLRVLFCSGKVGRFVLKVELSNKQQGGMRFVSTKCNVMTFIRNIFNLSLNKSHD